MIVSTQLRQSILHLSSVLCFKKMIWVYYTILGYACRQEIEGSNSIMFIIIIEGGHVIQLKGVIYNRWFLSFLLLIIQKDIIDVLQCSNFILQSCELSIASSLDKGLTCELQCYLVFSGMKMHKLLITSTYINSLKSLLYYQ